MENGTLLDVKKLATDYDRPLVYRCEANTSIESKYTSIEQYQRHHLLCENFVHILNVFAEFVLCQYMLAVDVNLLVFVIYQLLRIE